MNKITEITKRDIFDLFKNGYTQYDFFACKNYRIKYFYYGRLEEIEFLEKLYPIDEMPGKYEGYQNARQDIIQHTINNDDYDFCWIFTDDRFELLHGSDTKLLDFLCAVFHPENRKEDGYWHSFLERVNSFLKHDGYELYEKSKLSGRSVYAYREISPEEIASRKFVPFSVRNNNVPNNSFSINKKLRREIYNLFLKYNEILHRTDDTNWNYKTNSIESTIEDIKEFNIPKAFNSQNKHEETNNLEQFVMENYQKFVFDAIELFARNTNDTFPDKINLIFKNNSFPFKLSGGKIERTKSIIETKEIIEEPGLKELIDQATSLYRSDNLSEKQIAVEKLWDAFERLKTYYGAGNQKSISAEKIIALISNNDERYITLFSEEFKKLTCIGNDYRIRHHEMNKIDIVDGNYYDYLFQRCFALIDLVLKYLR